MKCHFRLLSCLTIIVSAVFATPIINPPNLFIYHAKRVNVVDAVKGFVDSGQLPAASFSAAALHWLFANIAMVSTSASLSIFMFRRFIKSGGDDLARAESQMHNKKWLRAAGCFNVLTKICIVIILLSSWKMWDIKNFFMFAGTKKNPRVAHIIIAAVFLFANWTFSTCSRNALALDKDRGYAAGGSGEADKSTSNFFSRAWERCSNFWYIIDTWAVVATGSCVVFALAGTILEGLILRLHYLKDVEKPKFGKYPGLAKGFTSVDGIFVAGGLLGIVSTIFYIIWRRRRGYTQQTNPQEYDPPPPPYQTNPQENGPPPPYSVTANQADHVSGADLPKPQPAYSPDK